MGGLCLISQPLVIALSMRFRILYNGQPILNADRIAQLADRFGAAPEIAELPVAFGIHRRPDDMVE